MDEAIDKRIAELSTDLGGSDTLNPRHLGSRVALVSDVVEQVKVAICKLGAGPSPDGVVEFFRKSYFLDEKGTLDLLKVNDYSERKGVQWRTFHSAPLLTGLLISKKEIEARKEAAAERRRAETGPRLRDGPVGQQTTASTTIVEAPAPSAIERTRSLLHAMSLVSAYGPFREQLGKRLRGHSLGALMYGVCPVRLLPSHLQSASQDAIRSCRNPGGEGDADDSGSGGSASSGEGSSVGSGSDRGGRRLRGRAMPTHRRGRQQRSIDKPVGSAQPKWPDADDDACHSSGFCEVPVVPLSVAVALHLALPEALSVAEATVARVPRGDSDSPDAALCASTEVLLSELVQGRMIADYRRGGRSVDGTDVAEGAPAAQRRTHGAGDSLSDDVLAVLQSFEGDDDGKRAPLWPVAHYFHGLESAFLLAHAVRDGLFVCDTGLPDVGVVVGAPSTHGFVVLPKRISQRAVTAHTDPRGQRRRLCAYDDALHHQLVVPQARAWRGVVVAAVAAAAREGEETTLKAFERYNSSVGAFRLQTHEGE